MARCVETGTSVQAPATRAWAGAGCKGWAVNRPEEQRCLRTRLRRPGRVSDLSCASAEHSPKRIPLDAHPDDPGMHLDGLGNTDRLPGEPLPPGPQRQRLARALLRVALTRRGRLALSLARVSAPRVRIIFRDSHGLQARFALPTYGVLATPTPRGQDLATAGIERRLQPARGFVPPHP
jgi:hypothetical protein